MHSKQVLTIAALALLNPAGMLLQAQSKAPAQDPSTYMHVSAPLAQRVLIQVKAEHNDIVKLGLHAVPPGETDNVIVANIDPAKIGKKSSAGDFKNLAENRAIATPLKDQRFDFLIPIHAADGESLNGGFLVMEIPYSSASTKAEAIKIGTTVRDQVQSMIPSKAAMYGQ